MQARIADIFLSVQGEGIYVGQPQIFIRFSGCNLNCDFCDTPSPKGRPYGVLDIVDSVDSLNSSSAANTISITGGEPLLYTDFLKLILPQFKKKNFRIYLETNGTLPGNLAKVLDFIDVIAMDMKLPSAQKKERSFWATHRDFLNRSRKKDVFVKVVVTGKTTQGEIKKVAAIIDDIDSGIPLVLQPVTPANRMRKKVSLNAMFEFQKLAKTILKDVRVIPQIHRILGAK